MQSQRWYLQVISCHTLCQILTWLFTPTRATAGPVITELFIRKGDEVKLLTEGNRLVQQQQLVYQLHDLMPKWSLLESADPCCLPDVIKVLTLRGDSKLCARSFRAEDELCC